MTRLDQALLVVALLLLSACTPRATTLEPYRRDSMQAEALEQRAEAHCEARYPSLPPHPFTTDGCTLWLDGDWVQCCVEHDIAYWCGGSAEERERSDETFRDCIAAAGSPNMAAWMLATVRIGGFPWYPVSWRWGYGWVWPHGYDDPGEGAAKVE